MDDVRYFFIKAEESRAGAESEFANGRYNNVANRCYYGCFQAAIAALLQAEIIPVGSQWSHSFVQSQFVGQLINRRKHYLPELRETLVRNLELRRMADYRSRSVSQAQAQRALQRTRRFIEAVRQGGEPS